jgi:imidazolonepropionase-like amidohydrolase
VGKRADLILLEANPLVDIRNVAHIENVVVRGKMVTKQAIDKILASHRRASGAK